MEELNKKLAKWAGFEYDTTPTKGFVHAMGWKDPDGHYLCGRHWSYLPNFPESLDACFKWLVPKLYSEYPEYSKSVVFYYHRLSNRWGCYFDDGYGEYELAETPALAFCLAIEKLIDSEEDNGDTRINQKD